MRPAHDSDNPVLIAAFPAMGAALVSARSRPDVPVAGTDQDAADQAEKIEGSFVALTYAQVILEGRALRFVPLDDVLPTLESLEAGRYPLEKTLHVVLPETLRPETVAFLAFLQSSAAIPLLRTCGYLPVPIPAGRPS